MKTILLNKLEFNSTFLVLNKKKILIIKKINSNNVIFFLLKKNASVIIEKEKLFIDEKYNIIYKNIITLKNFLNNGLKKKILLLGLGYQAFFKNEILNFKIGYSHTIILKYPKTRVSISIFKCRRKQINLILSGFNSEYVFNLFNKIINLKKPNTYKEIGFFNKKVKRKVKLFKKK